MAHRRAAATTSVTVDLADAAHTIRVLRERLATYGNPEYRTDREPGAR